ncbi:hypothetical protein BU23DRAFT_219717 [Bimuria novae-zelandiae CBS 107.79]|uniref:Uncharacterized protein n=1 Tax=Bimuria novae-zelandiae CBS 107.79 TaxID=1447943 RepID=A0A6A5UXW8_9PLEO|nr:hypothetical protein BU23DRAFT_219717 [Bimuria novae-zelandiae CBS 107.79]
MTGRCIIILPVARGEVVAYVRCRVTCGRQASESPPPGLETHDARRHALSSRCQRRAIANGKSPQLRVLAVAEMLFLQRCAWLHGASMMDTP